MHTSFVNDFGFLVMMWDLPGQDRASRHPRTVIGWVKRIVRASRISHIVGTYVHASVSCRINSFLWWNGRGKTLHAHALPIYQVMISIFATYMMRYSLVILLCDEWNKKCNLNLISMERWQIRDNSQGMALIQERTGSERKNKAPSRTSHD